jgi:hypothetical protein
MRKTGRAIAGGSTYVAKSIAGPVSAPFKRDREPVSDDIVVHRVRTKMGRVVSHPRAISVSASGGNVTLSGNVLKSEIEALLSCVSKVRGVNGVENRLDVRDEAGSEPSLQGESETERSAWQRAWAPATKIAAGATGGALAYYGARYAYERMRPSRSSVFENALNLIPFRKRNHIAWWQRPFA